MSQEKLLHLCLLVNWDPQAEDPPFSLDWTQLLPPQRFSLYQAPSPAALLNYLRHQSDTVDCLLLLSEIHLLPELQTLPKQLCEWGILLPTLLGIFTYEEEGSNRLSMLETLQQHSRFFYHNATVIHSFPLLASPPSGDSGFALRLHDKTTLLDAIPSLIDQAIALFLQMSPTCGIPQGERLDGDPPSPLDRVYDQQHRLSEKLKERLGYHGVYYHRDPNHYFRHLSSSEQKILLQRLRGLYQAIVLDYFQSPQRANILIDEFVALTFFADIGASQIVELHMSLMDDFANQLKLEGRNEEILLDYRITLIDVIAHLSEMYRRSIPKTSSFPSPQRNG
ncbi:MAG: circadian clock protein KaiA [Cyanobacteriota bacterium]|nr:circadian clock protein KaiA [Cyanobacteriota bacterium]